MHYIYFWKCQLNNMSRENTIEILIMPVPGPEHIWLFSPCLRNMRRIYRLCANLLICISFPDPTAGTNRSMYVSPWLPWCFLPARMSRWGLQPLLRKGRVWQGHGNLYVHRGGQSVCELQDVRQWVVRRRLLPRVHEYRQWVTEYCIFLSYKILICIVFGCKCLIYQWISLFLCFYVC